MQFDTIQKFFLWAVPTLFAITLHEVAHGWVARLRGDQTAARLGRLNLNPVKHMDLFGTVIFPVLTYFLGGFIFGWAKPVPIGWRNLKSPRQDMALVAVAGPLANLLMAVGWGLLAKLGATLSVAFPWAGFVLLQMGLMGIMINIMLMVFNLIPIPPLDGSRVVSSLLPPPMAWQYNRLERWGLWIVLILFATGILGRILVPAVQWGLVNLANVLGIGQALT